MREQTSHKQREREKVRASTCETYLIGNRVANGIEHLIVGEQVAEEEVERRVEKSRCTRAAHRWQR